MILCVCYIIAGLLAGVGSALSPSLPLHTQGRYVVDSNNERVKLACVNWYGAHLKTFVQNGLSKRTPDQIAHGISSMGFNCVRISFSTEAFVNNPTIRANYISKLAKTTNRTFLDVFDEVVVALTAKLLMVIINNHNSDAGWCCTMFDGNGLWFNGRYPESAWISSLKGMAERYRDNPLVVGYDLRNEVRPDFRMPRQPVWGDTTSIHPWFRGLLVDWRGAVERAGAAVLEVDPNALIIVEVLAGFMLCPYHLSSYPLESMNGHVVWSSHDYHWFERELSFSWDVCGHSIRYHQFLALWRWIYEELLPPIYVLLLASAVALVMVVYRNHDRILACSRCCSVSIVMIWFMLALKIVLRCNLAIVPIDSYESYVESRDMSWGHIVNSGIGPLWVGEFGTDTPNQQWNWSIAYMRERDLDFAYWSIDGEHFPSMSYDFGEHAGGLPHDESFGIWNPDYETVRHEWKLKHLQSLMAASSPAGVLRSSPKQPHASVANEEL